MMSHSHGPSHPHSQEPRQKHRFAPWRASGITDYTVCDRQERQSRPRRLLFLILALVLPGLLAAQNQLDLLFDRIGPEAGLSQSSVPCMVQDKQGFMWFGTIDGLNRFDGLQFKVFKRIPGDPTSLSDNDIWSITEDREGYLWIGTRSGGLNRFDPKTEKFQHYIHDPDNPDSLSAKRISSVKAGPNGDIWIGTQDGLNRLTPGSERFQRYYHDPENANSLGDQHITALELDPEGRLWIGTRGGVSVYDIDKKQFNRFKHDPGDNNSLSDDHVTCLLKEGGYLWVGTGRHGLNRLNLETGQVTRFVHQADNPNSLSNNFIIALYQDRSNVLWIGTRNGLTLYDIQNDTFRRYGHDPFFDRSLSDNHIRGVYADRGGTLWVSTFGAGINRYDPARKRFKLYTHHPEAPDGLSSNSIFSVHVTQSNELWVGTNDEGLNKLVESEQRFEHFKHDPLNPNSLSSNRITSLAEDLDGVIWVGTFDGLNRYQSGDRTFNHYQHQPKDPKSLAGNLVLALLVDKQNRLWCGTSGGGISRLDKSTGTFTNYNQHPENQRRLADPEIISLHQGPSGAIWAGGNDGLNRYQPERDLFIAYPKTDDPNKSLSHPRVSALYQSPDEILWIGTYGGGLNRLNPETEHFEHFTTKDGLPNDLVYGILSDDEGFLWLSTNRGIARFDPKTRSFKVFDSRDGLQGNEFNTAAYTRAPDGALYFGGTKGLTAFHPLEIRDDPHTPDIVLTELRIFNHVITPAPSQSESYSLNQAINYTDQLTFTHRETVFSLEFAALSLANPRKNRYRYKLEGFDKDWTETAATRRFAVYTGLPAGNYEFKVMGSNKDGVWSETPAAVKIRILPPIWKTKWAYALYTAMVLALIALYLRSQKRKLDYERTIVQRLKQVDNIKDEFLANTSHELRTPLNGIIGLAQSLWDGAGGDLSQKAKHDLSMIISSGKRLTGLVNDILDYSKMIGKNLNLQKQEVDLHTLVDVVLTLIRPLVAGKQVHLRNQVPLDLPPVWADENRLQQILYNLVGNAVKFTENGEVTVSAFIKEKVFHISIQDTGIGIPPDKIGRIFESFEQADASTSRIYGGTGLGLAITKKLVALHGGSIHVESTPNAGSHFYFTLPIDKQEVEVEADETHDHQTGPVSDQEASHREPPTLEVAAELPHLDESIDLVISPPKGSFKILVVDDEAVNRQVLINMLSLQNYTVIETSTGREALDYIEHHQDIDLVLLDIMMPRMSGYEVCMQIRGLYSVQELPVIFLTAKNRLNDLMLGFAHGANDFLSKPIEKGELLSRVKTHLELLYLNRELEGKVSERTRELQQKNLELQAQYRELDTLDHIVKTINQEVEFKDVVQSLLEQAIVLFPQAQKGAFLFVEADRKHFHFVSSVGYDLGDLRKAGFTRQELANRYLGTLEKIGEGVFVSTDTNRVEHLEPLPGIPPAKAMLAMSLTLDNEMVGFLVLDNLEDPLAFQDSEMGTILRFREHAISAVSKAKIMEDLVKTQKELIKTAHTAGMAEIATNVLHNVGNTLNSVRTSVHVIQETARRNKWLPLMEKIVHLFKEEHERLSDFLDVDHRNKQLPKALERIFISVTKQMNELQEESNRMFDYIQHMVEVLQEQRRYTQTTEWLMEACDLNRLVNEVLQMELYLLKDMKVELIEEYNPLPPVKVEKSKFTRILFYLLKNSWEAMAKKNSEDPSKIVLRTSAANGTVKLEIIDNGVGIPKENLPQVFVHGFTTKRNYRGFGLHYCANAMHEMNGSIQLLSDGVGQGTIVSLSFPVYSMKPAKN